MALLKKMTTPVFLHLCPFYSDNAASTNGEKAEESIFVAIPSYRDEETWPTIKSLVETACHPERVYIAVVFQSHEEMQRLTTANGSGISIESSQGKQETNLRSIIMDYRHAAGE